MARRTRRAKDVPRELHRRIEQLERDPLHPSSRSGRDIRGVGILVEVDDPPQEGWGWYGEYALVFPVDASWGWAGQVSAPRRVGAGYGWAGVIASDANPPHRPTAGWGWADIVTAPPSTSDAVASGWGWGGTVQAGTQPPSVLSADADDIGI